MQQQGFEHWVLDIVYSREWVTTDKVNKLRHKNMIKLVIVSIYLDDLREFTNSNAFFINMVG